MKAYRYVIGLVVVAFWLGNMAFAGFSILTSQVIVGGEKLQRVDSAYEELKDWIQNLALQAGKVCYQNEAFIWEQGASLSSVLLLESSLSNFQWEYSELYSDREQIVFMAYGPYSDVLGSWYLFDNVGFLALCSV